MKQEQEHVHNWSNQRLYRPNKKIPIEPIEHYEFHDRPGDRPMAIVLMCCVALGFSMWIGTVVYNWLVR